tara:strand:+ start:76 stop:810 length:735 start_codon:yes stop_codon:yes gene_type:complete
MIGRKIKRILFLIVDYYRFIRISLMNNDRKFSYIYKSKYWQNIEEGSLSGGGSNYISTSHIKKELGEFIECNQIKSMIDIPCGDWKWMSELDLMGIDYFGYDIVDDLILENKKRYAKENISFGVKNLIYEKLPKSDLIIIRDLLVHLDHNDIIKCLLNLDSSDFKFVGITNYPSLLSHKNRIFGDYLRLGDKWRPLNLSIYPYNLPSPNFDINDTNNLTEIDKGKYISIWSKSNFNIAKMEKLL